jgi:hypothetical protein
VIFDVGIRVLMRKVMHGGSVLQARCGRRWLGRWPRKVFMRLGRLLFGDSVCMSKRFRYGSRRRTSRYERDTGKALGLRAVSVGGGDGVSGDS